MEASRDVAAASGSVSAGDQPASAPAPAGAGSLLAVEGLSVRFGGVVALEEVSIAIAPGEALGVIGPNGAGKTTLFNAICGFIRPEQGRIIWRGEVLRRVRTHRLIRHGIARTLQGVGLFSGLTVLENVMVGAERFRSSGWPGSLLGLPRSAREEESLRARALDALARLGAADLAERMPGSLPYASQKRVALARALVGEPQLLLLDEPAGGLDAGELEQLVELLHGLRGAVAVMLVDHHMEFVAHVCERLVALDFGRVIAAGDAATVRRDPRVISAYLGEEAAAPGALAQAGEAQRSEGGGSDDA